MILIPYSVSCYRLRFSKGVVFRVEKSVPRPFPITPFTIKSFKKVKFETLTVKFETLTVNLYSLNLRILLSRKSAPKASNFYSNQNPVERHRKNFNHTSQSLSWVLLYFGNDGLGIIQIQCTPSLFLHLDVYLDFHTCMLI